MSINLMKSTILTAMDVLVFALCVDKGLTPVAVVGACYVALRLFNRDSTEAVNLIAKGIDVLTAKIESAIKEAQEKAVSDETETK